jgi:flagellin-like hook-associated protein FlgL
MVMRIGSNLNSLMVQGRLARASDSVTKISERLSSGTRIARASDDAAGLAISSSLKAQTRLAGQSVRNLNDGISALSIAEGALDALGTILARIEELSVQAMNGASNDTQRAVMQKEVTELQSEWNRIVSSTTFNGKQLLTGSGSRMVLQGGTGVAGALGVQIGEAVLDNGVENAAGYVSRVSTASSGVQGNGGSYVTAISADGRYVAFHSYASNLVSGDTNATLDAFIKDTVTGVTTRVSTDSSGLQGNSQSTVSAISADGRYVAFTSFASNLVSGDTNGAFDAFIKDTITGLTTRVSTNSSGVQGNASSSVTAISADGRYVAFNSVASNLVSGDTNLGYDAFIKDTLTGITTRVSTNSSGGEGDNDSYVAAISADGRYVAVTSHASNLVSGDTNGVSDAFIKDTVTGMTRRVSTNSSGGEGDSDSYAIAISADGRYVAFTSYASNLVSGDTNGSGDAFIKDTVTGITTRVSTISSGGEGDSDSYVIAISADGRYVAFTSDASNLVSGDTNGSSDAFIKDTVTGITTRVSTNSSGGEADYASYVAAISADGRYVALSSDASTLVGGDTNGTGDSFVKDLTKAGIQTLSGMVVNNKVSAGVSLNLIQGYRSELISHRANLGASMSRIESFVSAVGDARLTTSEAVSRITDADIAQESASLTASTIRQQIGASLLSQADKEPELILQLLRVL